MPIDADIRTLLLAQTAIQAVLPKQPIGGQSVDSMWLDKPPQTAELPMVVITSPASDPMLCLDGTYGARTTTLSINCYAASRPAADSLNAAITTFLDDYRGTAGASQVLEVGLQDTSKDQVLDDSDSDLSLFQTTSVFTVIHE